MCGETGHARVDDVFPSSPLIHLVAAGDLLVAVDELTTRELGTTNKVLIQQRGGRLMPRLCARMVRFAANYRA